MEIVFKFGQNAFSAAVEEPEGTCKGLYVAWLMWTKEGLSKDQILANLGNSGGTIPQSSKDLVKGVYDRVRCVKREYERWEVQQAAERKREALREKHKAVSYGNGVPLTSGYAPERSPPMPLFRQVEAHEVADIVKEKCGFDSQPFIRHREAVSKHTAAQVMQYRPGNMRSGLSIYRFIAFRCEGIRIGSPRGTRTVGAGHALAMKVTENGWQFFDPNDGQFAFDRAESAGMIGFLTATIDELGQNMGVGAPQTVKQIYTLDFLAAERGAAVV